MESLDKAVRPNISTCWASASETNLNCPISNQMNACPGISKRTSWFGLMGRTSSYNVYSKLCQKGISGSIELVVRLLIGGSADFVPEGIPLVLCTNMAVVIGERPQVAQKLLSFVS